MVITTNPDGLLSHLCRQMRNFASLGIGTTRGQIVELFKHLLETTFSIGILKAMHTKNILGSPADLPPSLTAVVLLTIRIEGPMHVVDAVEQATKLGNAMPKLILGNTSQTLRAILRKKRKQSPL